MKVKVTADGNMSVIEMKGEFVGGSETDDLRDALETQAAAGTPKLLIDMAGASYLNSIALGTLIAAHGRFTNTNSQVALCNVSKNIENIFVITKLTRVFTIYTTREEARQQMDVS